MRRDAGVLLLHGFAGGAEEVEPLRGALEALGYDVEAPVLRGHGGTRAELARATYADWLADAEAARRRLAARRERVAAVGFSMGGLAAICLNAAAPLAGLVTLNTPIYYWHKRRILYNLTHDFWPALARYRRDGMKAPPRALLNFLALLWRAKPLVERVTCPLLVLQARDDDTAHPRSAAYMMKRARGPKSAVVYQHGGHQILRDGDAADIVRRVDAFIRALLVTNE